MAKSKSKRQQKKNAVKNPAKPGDKRIGNEYWKLRKQENVGRQAIFSDPQQIWSSACLYFDWATNNPVEVKRTEFYKGKFVEGDVKKNRPFLLCDMLDQINITNRTWLNYRKKDDFVSVCTKIEEIIYSNKFIGAAIGEFNSNLITRDLGLADKKDHTSSDGSMTPKKNFNDFYKDDEEKDEE